MELMKEIECVFCGGRYCVVINDVDLLLPKNIKQGKAFPSQCPFCGPGSYAILVEGE